MGGTAGAIARSEGGGCKVSDHQRNWDLSCRNRALAALVISMRSACEEALAAIDEAYQATGYIKVAHTSEQRKRILTAIALAQTVREPEPS